MQQQTDKIEFLSRKAGQLAYSKQPSKMRDRRKRRSKDARKSWRNDGGW